MGTWKKLKKKAKKAVGGVNRQIGRSVTKAGQQAGHNLAKISPYVLGAGGYVLGGPVGAGIGAGIGTTLDRKYNDDQSWKSSLGTGAKAGIGTGLGVYGGEQILNYLAPEIMGSLGYGTTGPTTTAAGGNTVIGANGMAAGTVPKTVGAVPGAAPGLLGDLGGYGKYITPGNLMLGGLGYTMLKGGAGPQDDGGAPAPGTFSPQLPPYMGTGVPQQGMASQGMPGMDSGYMASQGMMNQLMARMQNPQMMQNPMQNPMFTR
jgi:hypothetical protein